MQVTERTKYKDFAQVEKYLTAESVAALKETAEKQYGTMYGLKFETFHECLDGNVAGVLGDLSEPTVLQVYWQKRLAEFVEEFAAALKRMTIRQTSDEIQASQGLLKQNWDESVLVFLQSFFGLKNYKEAEKITLGEILIAKKAAYNRDKFQRNMSNIISKKSGLK